MYMYMYMYGRLNLNHTCMLIMNFKVHSLTIKI